ncbi:hypothetical protein [Phenylobacterium sp.]|uniref:hypothetical protein n=1 Tax=Phenylobacterium sp. TaxID=1871053 RepID=UPI00391D6B58
MAGKTQPPVRAAIWDEIERFGPKSTPMRQPGALDYSPGPPKEDPLAFRPMSIKDHLDLARAPKKGERRGTTVTMYAYEIPGVPGRVDHAYVEFDDGRERLIARGGPSAQGPALFGAAMADQLHVVGGVVPAYLSRDEGKGTRVLFRGEVPGVPAGVAARGAQRIGRELARDPRRYTLWSNSNSYAGDVVEDLFRVRPGDDATPGSAYPLSGARRPKPSLDFSPALKGPGL